jgi:phosphoribosylanthranilate isomerase
MTQVKICGITNEEDALYAAQSGAAALGFIFYSASPRYITPEKAQLIIKKLPEEIISVGVFVNEKAEEVEKVVQCCNLDFVQLHGDESVEYCSLFTPQLIIKAVNLQSETDLTRAFQYNAAALLVDSRYAGLYGGTGRKANWDLALRVKKEKPLILSGGLNEENVKEALQKVTPQALDVILEIVRLTDLQQNNASLIFTKRRK